MVRGFAASFLLVVLAIARQPAEASGFTKKLTIYERQADDGPRHSPLFDLPVGETDVVFPKAMVLFNNDLYGSESGLLAEDPDDVVGYNQGFCVETVATDGFVAECFFTYVLDEGSLTANGPYTFDTTDGVLSSVLSVTGGTGDFKKVAGEVTLSAGPAVDFPSLQFDFELKNLRSKRW